MKKIYTLLFIFLSLFVFSQEICNNHIDEDRYLAIDLSDSDCQCNDAIFNYIPNPDFKEYSACPVNSYRESTISYATSWENGTRGSVPAFTQVNPTYSISAGGIAPPVITANDNQVYCPQTSMKIAPSIAITNDPLEPDAEAIYIQIAEGYDPNYDRLILTNPASHPAITSSWDLSTGKLKLYSPTGSKVLYTDFVAAIADVAFSNSSPLVSGNRSFSITIGQANYLPSTGHYYQFVPNLGITWTAAKTAAGASNYYGLQGYLATLVTLEEATLAGKQASGAGWIGGSDAANEGVWKWVTGPEGLANGGTGTVFWNGNASGSTPNFAFWNTGEPNQYGGAPENYAHITAPGVGITGSWNDLTNTGEAIGDYQPKGYIVEYGGMLGDPVLHISASTSMKVVKINNVSTSGPVCGSGTVTFNATANGLPINWYDAPVGGTWLGTGTSFTTPIITSTKSYYADAGCPSRTEFIAVVNPIPSIPTFTKTDPTCLLSTGSITITSSASQYSFDNGATWQTSNTKSGLASGSYQIKVKNTSGCESPATMVTIAAAPNAPSAPTFTKTDPTCSVSTGSITITSSASQYSFDNGVTWQTSNTKSNLLSGNYNIKVKNISGCESPTVSVIINTFPGIPTAPTFTKTDPTCSVSTGSITITSSASQYSFDNGATWQTSNTKSGLLSGNYSLKVKNIGGCESPVSFVTINAPLSVPTAPTFTKTDPTCSISTGSITITSSASQYSFDNGATWQTSNTKSNLVSGSYNIKVKNVSGCESEAVSVTIAAVPNVPAAPTFTQVNPTCSVSIGSITITSSASEYSFDNGLTWQTSNTQTGLTSGSYQIKVKNASGCESVTTMVILNSDTFGVKVASSCTQSTLVEPIGGVAPYEYSLDGITYQSSPLFLNVTGYYNVYVRDSQGCIAVSDRVFFSSLGVTQAFSPNGDGINDIWDLSVLQGCPNARVYVYDRYGRKLWETNDTQLKWDGIVKGKPVPSDTYWFAIDFNDGKTPIYKSHVTIKRNYK